MTRNDFRESLSRYVDGEVSAGESAKIEELLATSPEAQDYLEQLRQLRRHIRYEPADSSIDVTERVMAAVSETGQRPPARRLRLAAAFAAGIVAGAAFIGIAIRQPAPVAAADIPRRVLAAQSHVTSLTAQLRIIERGWHPDVGERTFVGQIAYRAPESLWVEIRDETTYPSNEWMPNHTTLVVDERVAWSQGVAGCPTEVLPGCTPSVPRVMVVTDREPFPEVSPAPLDLIVPAGSFSRSGEPVLIGLTEIDGRAAVGVEVTAAQVSGLVEGLTSTGNWRDVHPTDRAELWLDRDALVPLALSVFAADTADRRLWAIRHGYVDEPDVPFFEVRWTDVSLDPEPSEFPPIPSDVEGVSSAFTDIAPMDLEALTPQRLPDGLMIHRSGSVATGSGPLVSVVSWSDGRAWLKVRWTDEWHGSRLFGDLGALVREVPVGSGIGYLNERGDRIGLHGSEVDLVLMGSLPTETLLAVAATLDVIGQPVPANWAEAGTATLDEALAAVDGLLVPQDLKGFATPAIRVESDIAILAYAGPGNRAFLLAEAVDDELSPPLEANVRGVTVRGIDGRYSPERGLLEWVEGKLTISLSSTTLSLDELLTVAESLRSP